jgi:hypothetical protein
MIDFADVKPSVLSWIIVGLLAVTFIIVGKWLFARVHVPGVSDVFMAV